MGERILIIDDDEIMRTVLSDVLQTAGYEVTVAEDGDQGLQFYRDDPTDLVITDVVMPKQSGVWVVTKIMEENPKARIIAMSAGGEGSDFLRMTKILGAVQTLQKPVLSDALIEAVENALSSSDEPA